MAQNFDGHPFKLHPLDNIAQSVYTCSDNRTDCGDCRITYFGVETQNLASQLLNTLHKHPGTGLYTQLTNTHLNYLRRRVIPCLTNSLPEVMRAGISVC